MSSHGCTVVLLRHAPTSFNALNLFQGQCDPPLSPEGVNNARAAARHLAKIDWAAIVSSPQLRARQTRDIIAEIAGRKADGDVDDLRERNLSHLDQRSRIAVEADTPGTLHRLTADPDYAPDGGESLRGVAARTTRALASISANSTGPTLAVTHGGVLTALQLCAQDVPQPSVVQPAHALVATIYAGSAHSQIRISATNLDAHEVHEHLDKLSRATTPLERMS